MPRPAKSLKQLLQELKDEIGVMPMFVGPHKEFYEAQAAKLGDTFTLTYNSHLIVEFLLAIGEKTLELEDRLSKLEKAEKLTKRR